VARQIKDDIRLEITAVREAGDKDRGAQELGLVRRLDDEKKRCITQLVSRKIYLL